MKKWKAIASIILVFLLGAVAGALVTHRICQQRLDHVLRGEARATGELIVQRLNRELQLDPAQLEQLRAIVKETHAEIRIARRQIRPQIDEILARSQEKVRALLRPGQREKYEKIIAERKKRREQADSGDGSQK